MRFRVDSEFPAVPAVVAEMLCDAAFHTALDLPDLSRPEVVARSASGAERHLRLRYEFVGHLDPIARRLLAGRRLTWIQDLRIDPTTGIGQLSFAAEAEPERLYGTADVALVAVGDAGTHRRVEGSLSVKVPLVGATAERRIVPGLVRRLAVEAEALATALSAP